MEHWIQEIINSGNPSAWVLAAVFLMGFLSVFTCSCNIAILGVVAGYSGASGASGRTGTELWKGFSFLAGTVVSMSLIGALFGFAGGWMVGVMGNYWKIVAGMLAILFGLFTLGWLPVSVPSVKFPKGEKWSGNLTAILFGLAVGGLSSACNTCCNPFFPVILAVSFVKGSAVWGFLMLVFFALGFGLPLAALIFGTGLGMGKLRNSLEKVLKPITYLAGVILIAFGFYLLWTF